MLQGGEQAVFIDSWLKRSAGSLPAQRLLSLAGRALEALRLRAVMSLGDTTLAAVGERVLDESRGKFPLLGALKTGPEGFSFEGLEEKVNTIDRSELRRALSFLLSTYLEILEHLSGGVLSRPLRAQLAGLGAAQAGRSPRLEPRRAVMAANKSLLRMMGTGVTNLDAVLGGGLPAGSVTALVGMPGTGKTLLAHQICFHNAGPGASVLYFSTLSEPPSKRLLYMAQFDYFDERKVEESIRMVDLGKVLRASRRLSQISRHIIDPLRKLKPALVVIDSFKVFNDMSGSAEEIRRFTYEIVTRLTAWDCTALLLGEYASESLLSDPLFSVIDGVIMLKRHEAQEERLLQVLKLRGTANEANDYAFEINRGGITVLAPRLTIRREPFRERVFSRVKTGIAKLDELLSEGIPQGSSLLVSGSSGTGKTVLLLEFLIRGALAGEKGILFSFEETTGRLLQSARSLGWDLADLVARGLLDIVFTPQPDILIESDLRMMHGRIRDFKPKRLALDSLSVYLHKVEDPRVVREKTFQLASIVEEAAAVGLFATDVPYGVDRISRLGVEETVVDGTIVLSTEQDGLDRARYIEVYKLRSTAHLAGRHAMVIEKGGLKIFPRYNAQLRFLDAPPALEVSHRVATGVPGLDALLQGGLLARSSTIVSGSAGTGKSTLALQFVHEGAKQGEKSIYVTLEEGSDQILAITGELGIPLREQVESGQVEIMYFSPKHLRAAQFLTVLTDKIEQVGARRLAVDSTSHLVSAGGGPQEAQQLLYNLVVRLKTLGVTSLLTLESDAMHPMELITERGVSLVADNLIMLRYSPFNGHEPNLTVIKTRGSAHASETHSLIMGKGGLRVGARLDGKGFPAAS